ncbi:MAG TPA: sigma-70 family RNA polymerase sigma factor [Candidatus Limnocylindrales bacterium]|nr:sigma-70 family RNA polymerase sigma factor [Candidatus Limnocylindrales bacterium]
MGDGRQLYAAPSIADPTRTRGRRIATTEGLAPPVLYDERAIVDRVLAGDREAFRALVEREGPGVVRACHRVLADLHEAEDAAQEAFVTAYGALATWRRDGTFGAWLTRIAVRIALRRAQRRKPVAWIDPGDPGSALDVAGGVDPAAATLRAERDGAVRRAVAGLDEPYREIVSLRYFGELSLNEIADVTGRPLGTVKTHLHRGLARLRTSLEGRAP